MDSNYLCGDFGGEGVFACEGVDLDIDSSGDGVDALFGKREGFGCDGFVGHIGKPLAHTGVAIPVGSQGEEVAEFGGVI